MMNTRRFTAFYFYFSCFFLLSVTGIPSLSGPVRAQSAANLKLPVDGKPVPEPAKSWVFWYWMHGAYSKAGITADLEAMKEAGIGGAYLMPIKGVTDPPLYEPAIDQLSPEWWDMVRHAMNEADRLGLKLAMHVSDGFATAGGPWITPELSMQKVVWTKTFTEGGRRFDADLPQPENYEGYYRDIAVFAFPTLPGATTSTRTVVPEVTTSKPGVDAQFLADENSDRTFESEDACWIQYAFDEPFTCRSITIHSDGQNYHPNRLRIKVSDDGKHFRPLVQLQPPRHGWQDWDAPVTHSVVPTIARYFRFIYNKEGSEPGAEDLDAAKWSPELEINGIELSGAPRIHQFEGKTGEVWRISPRTTAKQVPDSLSVPLNRIINITEHLNDSGRLTWDVPAGNWTILRVGHTSTGHMNNTGGAGKGLEADKFNPKAVRMQFDHWFEEAIRQAGPELASRVLEILHIDSWEAGSQNWSTVFREEFRKRRGYDLLAYLPAMAGIPVESADVSERFLHDVRQTIAELVHDNFYETLLKLAHEHGVRFSAENVSPTMTSDGMLHFEAVDIPMGEFWLRSPTHDKPNDMLDAISGGHIYGKPIIQAEAFTQLRMAWDEHPGMLKALGDRNYALGINRFVYHVFMHNPWPDRKPGMTLDGVGLYFQRDQTWWEPGRAWVKYAQRCQTLLQQGRPVVDIAVFTGEETPRRAVLPDRLVPTLPGIFGPNVVESEQQRLANRGEPLREIPDGVTHSANMADAEDWINPLRGYAYDSINRDALLRLAEVRDGRIVLPGGASYGLLVLPGSRRMSPHGDLMTPEVAKRLLELVKAGATLLVSERPVRSPSLQNYPESDRKLQRIIDELWEGKPAEINAAGVGGSFAMWRVGRGRVIQGPWYARSFDMIGIERDLIVKDSMGEYAQDIVWTHRTAPGYDIYFISNQRDNRRTVEVSLREDGHIPELYNPVTSEVVPASDWDIEQGRTVLPVRLAANGSVFIILRERTERDGRNKGNNWLDIKMVQTLKGTWDVAFSPELGGPENSVTFNRLADWTTRPEPGIRYYSGTATYTKIFQWNRSAEEYTRVWLDLGEVANLAEVKVNGVSCGVAWTAPYRVEITGALKEGENKLNIEVTNTWANRMIGDHTLPENERITRTIAPYRLEGKPLLEAGLLGPVTVQTLQNSESSGE